MHLKTISEHEISPEVHAEITSLRNSCFPECRLLRSYFKQLPHLRVLAYNDDILEGHLEIDHRMIRIGSAPVKIFRVIDLCVAESVRNKGIATLILDEVERLARISGIEALILIADDHRIYKRFGFTAFNAEGNWLRIEEHTNYGIASENLSGELMGKALDHDVNLEDPVDFLGYLF